MGLFDFLKKKNSNTQDTNKLKYNTVEEKEDKVINPISPATPEPVVSQSISPVSAPKDVPETYYGDLEKTGILVDLSKVPQEKRNEAWLKSFISNVSLASFKAGDPQVITGPDGFPYFNLLLPEPGETFQCYVIDNMVFDFLATQGLGIVIGANKEQPDWVFTYGDVMNYAVKRDFYNKDNTFFNTEPADNKVTFASDKEIMVGQPSEFLLPKPTRDVLRGFLNFKGIKEPKVLLMSSNSTDGKQVQDLVFNFTPKNFSNEDEFRGTVQQMQWFLPRHYSVTFFDEDSSLKSHFEAL